MVATGRHVRRNGAEPGAVLARVASSHIRVGTFEFAARQGEVLQSLADFAIARHYPELSELPATGTQSVPEVLRGGGRGAGVTGGEVDAHRFRTRGHEYRQHDNFGETIDYGPCAFLDAFDPAAVFSSIDHGGRYAFGNQPAVLKWNLARLAETLLPLIDSTPDESISAVSAVLETFDERYENHYAAGVAAKLGLAQAIVDRTLVDDLLTLLAEHGADWTGSFRALADELRGDSAPSTTLCHESTSRPGCSGGRAL
ncbi:hypothetical protein GCM10020255_074320 [Rhodococcus baikonurensis]